MPEKKRYQVIPQLRELPRTDSSLGLTFVSIRRQYLVERKSKEPEPSKSVSPCGSADELEYVER